MSEPADLRVYRFEPGAVFEGGLLGAIERMQLGHDGKLLDALFLRRDRSSGALDAVDLATGAATPRSRRCSTFAWIPAGAGRSRSAR